MMIVIINDREDRDIISVNDHVDNEATYLVETESSGFDVTP